MEPTPTPTDNIYEALRASHERQRELCSRLTRTRKTNPELRTQTLRELKLELAAHAAAEERFLYVPMLMEDMGIASSRHALAEHHEIEELVEKLEGHDPGGEAWAEHAKALSHEVRHHLKEEETKFFQVSGKILGDAQKATLAHRYAKDYRRMLKVLAG